MKTITINDGFTTTDIYTLTGSVLKTDVGKSSSGTDILNDRQCAVSEDMTDEQIRQTIWESWTADTYDGDPYDNGLVVIIEESES